MAGGRGLTVHAVIELFTTRNGSLGRFSHERPGRRRPNQPAQRVRVPTGVTY